MWSISLSAIDTPNGDCVTGDIRLQAAAENVSASALEGRLELCVNNAWGTVCDSLVDTEDADVACSRLRGFTREGVCPYVVTVTVYSLTVVLGWFCRCRGAGEWHISKWEWSHISVGSELCWDRAEFVGLCATRQPAYWTAQLYPPTGCGHSMHR